MIVGLSDLHIGALVDTNVNQYNFNIALERLSVYASKIIREANMNNITDLHVVNLGDVIEHSSMRFNQGYNVEFLFSDQIVRASDLIIKFLMFLAEKDLMFLMQELQEITIELPTKKTQMEIM